MNMESNYSWIMKKGGRLEGKCDSSWVATGLDNLQKACSNYKSKPESALQSQLGKPNKNGQINTTIVNTLKHNSLDIDAY